MPDNSNVSNAMMTFGREAPEHAAAWNEYIQKMAGASALDKKTAELVYIAVLAATRIETGIAWHVKSAKALGATREEIISAILIALPPAGTGCLGALPVAISAFDSE